jgi:hypothetical protein
MAKCKNDHDSGAAQLGFCVGVHSWKTLYLIMDSKWPMACALGGCLLLMAAGTPLLADDENEAANPYAVIAERNVFHLNPPPPPPEPDEKPKEDLPVIKITGIVKIGNKTRALFVTQPKNNKDAPTYFNLAEGERDGILEVVKINAEDQKVDVINSGKPATLTVKDDSLEKNEGSPPPGEAGEKKPPFPPMPGIPNLANRRPPPAFPGMTQGANGAAPYTFPQRPRRVNLGAAPRQ